MIIITTHWYVPMQDYEFEGKKVFQGIEDETGLILFQKKFFQNCLKHIVWPALRSPPRRGRVCAASQSWQNLIVIQGAANKQFTFI